MKGKKYKFQAEVWLWPAQEAAWHFVSVPKEISSRIKKQEEGKRKRGFGAVKVEAQIGSTKWMTSIFPDKKSGCYVLPLKAAVRKKEGLMRGDEAAVTLIIQ